jgi:hydroxymethylpyrimidine/phosphomethylpyrimidine kinase
VQPSCVLTIAGSDSGGGAGVQADLRTFAAFEVHGLCAITAVTAQTTLGVHDVHLVPASTLREQIRAVLSDFDVKAVKTGMIGSPELLRVVGEFARSGQLPHLVVDPVLVSTTGASLFSDPEATAYRDELFASASLLTPNLSEACVLAGIDQLAIATADDVVTLGETLLSQGAQAVLVKGGHSPSDLRDHATDILVTQDGVTIFDGPRITTDNDHGTGCSLSAAIACGLAAGASMADAIAGAKAFVASALEGASSWRLGSGRGPLDHLGWNTND